MLTQYYRLMSKSRTKRYVYPIELANEIWTLVEDNQHIFAGEPGTYYNCKLLDFKAFYPNLLSKVLLPYGKVLKKAPKGAYCKFHECLVNGEYLYIWDEMLQFYNYKVHKTYYMKLGDKYHKLGKLILKMRDLHPDKKGEYMIFGCFFYGKKQNYNWVENFFAGSYLYVQAYLIMHDMITKLHDKGCVLINTATDSILFSGDVEIPQVDYKYSIKLFDKVVYRAQNNWTGYVGNNIIIEKHQGIAYENN